jgi:hypothetical protein
MQMSAFINYNKIKSEIAFASITFFVVFVEKKKCHRYLELSLISGLIRLTFSNSTQALFFDWVNKVQLNLIIKRTKTYFY